MDIRKYPHDKPAPLTEAIVIIEHVTKSGKNVRFMTYGAYGPNGDRWYFHFNDPAVIESNVKYWVPVDNKSIYKYLDSLEKGN